MLFFFFKQKTAYEMRISDWSSDVCSSDLGGDQDGLVLVEVVLQQALVELLAVEDVQAQGGLVEHQQPGVDRHHQRQVQLHDHALGEFEIGRASCRERGCQYV